MLHAGFAPQVRRIASELPASRQTLLYSATWPKEVRQVAASFTTREPLHVFIGNVSVRCPGCVQYGRHIFSTEHMSCSFISTYKGQVRGRHHTFAYFSLS